MRERQQRTEMISILTRAVPCQSCALPALEIRAGQLIVRNRHHGTVHTNAFSLAWLKEQLERTMPVTDEVTQEA